MTDPTLPRVWACCGHCPDDTGDLCEIGHTAPCLTCQVDSPRLFYGTPQ